MTKRALWREYVGVAWHLHSMTWPEFLELTVGDRMLLMEELNALIDRHNEEAGAVPDPDRR